MVPLHRRSVVVRPSLPYINWIRSVVGAEISLDDVKGGVYLVSLGMADQTVDAVIDRYWISIFKSELIAWTPDEKQWPAPRDLATFNRWFDVELHQPVVDLDSDPIYFDADDYDLISDWEEDLESLEAFDDALLDVLNKDLVEISEPAPYHELFPPSPFDLTTQPRLMPPLPEKGRTQGLIYEFKILLAGIDPTVWRRIQVPAGYTFWDLHVAIADAMGWLDSHLHLFSVRNPDTKSLDPIGIYDEEEGCLPDHLMPIAAYFREPGDRAWYTYDYGDMWVHDVVLEQIVPRVKSTRYPKCLDGARACPLEDSGGPHGYLRMLKIIDTPSHPEYENFREWLGDSFDPDDFSPRAVRFDNPKKRWEMAFLDEE